jgi:hypothetical protein
MARKSFNRVKFIKTTEEVIQSNWFHRVIKYGPTAVKYIPLIIVHGPKIVLSTASCFVIGYIIYQVNIYINKYQDMKINISNKVTGVKDSIGDTCESIKDGVITRVTTMKDGISDKMSKSKDTISNEIINPVTERMTKIKERSVEVYENMLNKTIKENEDSKESENIESKLVSLKDSIKEKFHRSKQISSECLNEENENTNANVTENINNSSQTPVPTNDENNVISDTSLKMKDKLVEKSKYLKDKYLTISKKDESEK